MIGEAFLSIFLGILSGLPVITLPDGVSSALDFVTNVVGFVNIFVPLQAIVPIIILIIAVRRFNVVMSVVNWILRLIPFIG